MKAADSVWINPRLQGRLPELDGVRGLAILLVLIWHFFSLTVDQPQGSWQRYVLLPFRLSWSGVDLFFVLSGFLIGGILYDARSSGNYYRTFYLRRVHRIFPLYFVVLALFALGLVWVGPDATGLVRDLFSRRFPLWSYALFLQNFFMSWYLTPGALLLGATWSLAVEEQFYMLLPFFMRRLSVSGITRLVLASIVAAPLIRIAMQQAGNDYFGPYTLLPCRADALGFGVLIAIACRNRKSWEWLESHRAHIGAAFVVLCCGYAYLLIGRYVFSVGLTWIAAMFASLLLLVIVNPGKVLRRIFVNPILRQLGIGAYCIYLFHSGINEFTHLILFGHKPAIHGWSTLAATLVSMAVVFLIAAASWRWFEKPLIRRAHSRYQYNSKQHAAAML